MNTEDLDLTEQQSQRIESIERELDELDQRESELLEEIEAVLEERPEPTAP